MDFTGYYRNAMAEIERALSSRLNCLGDSAGLG